MSQFTDPLIVEKVGAHAWKLYTEFDYHVGSETSLDVIQVPKDFVTDFASIPRLFWALLPPDGKYTGAAIVHDFLYTTKTRPKAEADRIFLEAMKVLGVNWFVRSTMYNAVRWFGRY